MESRVWSRLIPGSRPAIPGVLSRLKTFRKASSSNPASERACAIDSEASMLGWARKYPLSELLPSNQGAIDEVASRVAMTERSLQCHFGSRVIEFLYKK